MGILETARNRLQEEANKLNSIQEILDIKPLDNEKNWEEEFRLILVVNALYKDYLVLLDKYKETLGQEEYKRLRLEAYNIAHTGREYVN